MLETVPGLKAIPIAMDGGVDEVSPSDRLRPEDALKMTNWRLSKDGKRLQKRAGLQEEDTAFAEDVYGYATYYNTTPAFCKIAVLESEVQRKVGAGAWANIFDFTSNIDHTVNVIEAQGKQFVITEKGSKVILPDGSVRQIGITAPTVVPSASAAYAGSSTPPVNDLMNYATQGDMDAVWADNDGGTSASTLDTTDPDGTAGPDADGKYMRLLQGSAQTAGAKRTKSLTGTAIGLSKYSVQLATYFDVLSELGWKDGFRFKIDNAVFDFTAYIGKDGVWLNPRNGIAIRAMDKVVPVNKWITWNVTVDATDMRHTKVNFFMSYDGFLQAQSSADFYPEDTSGVQKAELYTFLFSTVATDVHVDHFKIYQDAADMARISGLYRYAVSFLRTGNYGCESNALKSSIGSVVFAGTGVNDMTVDSTSEYTGANSKSILVKLKTAAAPQDTIQWSGDGGQTWSAEIKLATKVHLGEGITVNFATITGHTANDTWTIPANCCSAIATMQQITVSSIPTSSDEQVTARKLYRTAANGSTFYYLTTIYDRVTTTQFIDNFPDATLGDELEEDRDLFSAASTTIGKCSEWWDNRLWIADHAENIVYYSAIREGGPVPEEFSLDERFIPINRGDQDDTITAMKAYKDALYVFKRNDIFIIQKTSVGYAPYHLNSDLGCVADNCVEIVNDFLMFPSERGLELYDGVRAYSPEFSVAVNETFRTADPAGFKYMSIAHDKQFNEVWLNIPSRLSGAAAITIVWNYIRNKFFFFQFYKTPSWIGRCKDSTGASVLKMGTRDGYVLLCDYGTADHTTAITATYRKGWLDMLAHGIVRAIQTDYEIPATKTLTMNLYVNMDKDVARTAALTGDTPSATDISLRRPIGAKTELGLRARWVSVEYVNAEDCGGDCKINDAVLYLKPEVVKNRIDAD
jgi:hypothetical protein